MVCKVTYRGATVMTAFLWAEFSTAQYLAVSATLIGGFAAIGAIGISGDRIAGTSVYRLDWPRRYLIGMVTMGTLMAAVASLSG